MVDVNDVQPPARPRRPIDELAEYLAGPFLARKQAIRARLRRANDLGNKHDVVQLGFEVLDFRLQVGLWAARAQTLLDAEMADRLDDAADERWSEAQEQGRGRPTTDLIKSRALQFAGPLKEAQLALRTTYEWLDGVRRYCEAVQRSMVNEEWDQTWAASNQVPEELFDPVIGSGLH